MKRIAFTLIELLVVIAIIAILASILFPVFAKAKEAAKKTQCLAQTKQIGTSLMMYLSDYDDRYPQEHPSSANPAIDDKTAQLESIDFGSPFDKILPYVAGGKDTNKTLLFVCPTDVDPHGKKLLDTLGNCIGSSPLAPPPGPLSSFVLNSYYLFGATSTQIENQARSIYISERNNTFCDVHYHPWLDETEVSTGPMDSVNPIAIGSRHLGMGCYVYADGHAKVRPFEATRQPFEGHELYGEHQAF